jgi:hypothetical protein
MSRWQRLGAGPPGKGARGKQAASQPHKPYFIGQTVGGVFDRNPTKELGEGKAEDFLADLPFVRPVE